MTDLELIAALDSLWCIPAPGPSNLLSTPAFVALVDLCEARYGGGKARFALSNALRSLGLPCMLPVGLSGQATPPRDAARALNQAQMKSSHRKDFAISLSSLKGGAFAGGRLSGLDGRGRRVQCVKQFVLIGWDF